MSNRPLANSERELAQWMLMHGEPGADRFLDQLNLAEVTPWRCPCGCASINFQIKGQSEPPPGVRVLGDFLCGEVDAPSGVFIFQSAGILRGIEVYGLAGEAPHLLPELDELRPFDAPHGSGLGKGRA
jgi:hypothetical protein